MGDTRSENASFEISSTQLLRYAGGVLALLVAGLHLFHPQYGLSRLVLILTTDPGLLITHPRPAAFVLSAIAIVVGIYLALFEVARRQLYLLGIALMLTYIGGYIAWHLSGHGSFLPGREPHYHGHGPLETVITHLRNDGWAALAIASEATLAVILAVLYRREGATPE